MQRIHTCHSDDRERAMLGFRRMRSLQKFAFVHASVTNHFNQERSLSSRPNFKLNRAAALTERRGLCSGSGTAALSRLRPVRIRLPETHRAFACARETGGTGRAVPFCLLLPLRNTQEMSLR